MKGNNRAEARFPGQKENPCFHSEGLNGLNLAFYVIITRGRWRICWRELQLPPADHMLFILLPLYLRLSKHCSLPSSIHVSPTRTCWIRWQTISLRTYKTPLPEKESPTAGLRPFSFLLLSHQKTCFCENIQPTASAAMKAAFQHVYHAKMSLSYFTTHCVDFIWDDCYQINSDADDVF